MPTFSVDFCTVSSLDVGAFNHFLMFAVHFSRRKYEEKKRKKKKRSNEEKLELFYMKLNDIQRFLHHHSGHNHVILSVFSKFCRDINY